ncbi:MAG: hypothetical protein MOIL_01345 [Candidatus Methanolliviera sp. GoM_oil]|nr:MAG: hypothetical protein MOIL_01345 [Candidatus Methanolliviera sp. GoM_oil]
MAGIWTTCIESCCESVCGGLTGACSQWLPHAMKTCCDPICEGCFDCINTMCGK